MESVSSIAVWSSRVAVTALAVCLLGPVLGQVGAPGLGFALFALGGVLLSLVAVLLGAAGLWSTRSSAGLGGRGRARLGAVLGIALLVTTLAAARTSSISKGGAAELPRINDITTNTADPPTFAKIADLDANAGRDMGYPGPEFAQQQQQAYPDLAPIRLTVPPGKAFQQCRDAAVALGWEIVDQDPMVGRIEATDSTAIFRFVDDVAIRLRPGPEGSTIVDIRSKSRVGRGDLGANAGRIRAFRDALEG